MYHIRLIKKCSSLHFNNTKKVILKLMNFVKCGKIEITKTYFFEKSISRLLSFFNEIIVCLKVINLQWSSDLVNFD